MTTTPPSEAVSAGRAAPRRDWEADVAVRAAGPEFVPHVIAWNLTRRCNLECAHCYISAGAWHAADEEMSTAECLRVVDEILEVNPAPMLILCGGEPLLRDDLEAISRRAADGGATVVVGTNGTRLTRDRIDSLKAAGVRGVAVSIDSLDPAYHDRFRHGSGSLDETLAAIERLREAKLDFVVQTTVTRGNRGEIAPLAAWAAEKGAVSFNCYFVVATGRASGMHGLSSRENDEVLAELVALGKDVSGAHDGALEVPAPDHAPRLRGGSGIAAPRLRHPLSVRRPVLPDHARRKGHALSLHARRGGRPGDRILRGDLA